MKSCSTRSLLAASLVLVVSSSLSAQTIPGWETKQFSMERLDADRVRLMRQVEVVGVGPNAGQQIFADDLLWNTRTGELTAEGNVLLVSPTGRIAAERVVFNTKTKLGTYYTASGLVSLGARAAQDKSMFGTLEPDVMFYGETIEKIGDDRYKITHGGFTTCVQPTPRWDIVSGSATIDLEDYAILRNAVLRVKDVPVLYLPIMYYPIQSDDRATGFLMPSYGNSTYQGQSISNAFFWAVNRSQDVTLLHDWYFTRGQGYGTEYRYLLGTGSEGQFRAYRRNESALTTARGEFPARQSYELRGSLTQRLPAGLRATARVDYFSDITSRQLHQTNFLDLNYNTRILAGNISGNWAGLSTTAGFNRYEAFYGPDYSSTTGASPTFTASLSSRQIAQLPLFVSTTSEFTRQVTVNTVSGTVDDRTLWRGDLAPSIRANISNLPFLTTTGTFAWRYTYYSDRLSDRVLVPESFTRRFFDMGLNSTGPVFTRVFGSSSGRRIKHAIEPTIALRRTTSFQNISVPVVEYIVPDVTSVTYGLNNRIIVRPAADTREAARAARELLTVGVQQTYYSNPSANVFDYAYSLSALYRTPKSVSPVSLSIRSAPVTGVNTEFRMEYDTTTAVRKILGLSLNGGVASRYVQANAGWSKRPSFGEVVRPDSYFQGSTTLKSAGNTFGGTYSFNYDINRSALLQQHWIGHYSAQCCGILLEYQEYNFPVDPRFPIPKDRRFNLSFSLAGVGSFSNFFGAFGGGTRY